MNTRILIVDDHAPMAAVLADALRDEGHEVATVDSGEIAIERLTESSYDVVLTDLRMPKVDGFDVLRAARRLDDPPIVVLMTAFGSIDTAVEGMRLGAAHYLVKPCKLDEVKLLVARSIEERELRRENRRLRHLAATTSGLRGLIGQSPALRALAERVIRVAQSSAPVLIRAESGTGKELVARALHEEGPRRGGPFVAVNCTAIPEQLLESELFGHVRGAFTGATGPRKGLFVEADGGTLFLDEIGDMPAPLQAKLLRVLEESEVRAVGSDQSRKVDVRIVAATHRDLDALVRAGTFRQDLLFRLDVVPLAIPPLRERLGDIPLLAAHFLMRSRARNPTTPVERLSPELVAQLALFDWPGNVRQLENLIERLVVIGARAQLEVDDLETIGQIGVVRVEPLEAARRSLPTLRQLESQYIAWVLTHCEGNKTRAAELLGIDVSTLHRRERQRDS